MKWDVIHTYTRKEAIADGYQIDVSATAKEAGIKFPVFITREVYDLYVKVPEGKDGKPIPCQDERGRLWDVVWMLRFAITQSRDKDTDTVKVLLRVRNRGGVKLVELKAVVGPMDIDDPAPAITVMMPDED